MNPLPIHTSAAMKSCTVFKKIKSFTMISLLIVITIIGILASLLTPTIQSSLDHAKAAKSIGNLH